VSPWRPNSSYRHADAAAKRDGVDEGSAAFPAKRRLQLRMQGADAPGGLANVEAASTILGSASFCKRATRHADHRASWQRR
jgi:hypothetical protein